MMGARYGRWLLLLALGVEGGCCACHAAAKNWFGVEPVAKADEQAVVSQAHPALIRASIQLRGTETVSERRALARVDAVRAQAAAMAAVPGIAMPARLRDEFGKLVYGVAVMREGGCGGCWEWGGAVLKSLGQLGMAWST